MNTPAPVGAPGGGMVRPIIPRPNPGRLNLSTIRAQVSQGHAPQLPIHQILQHAGALKSLAGILGQYHDPGFGGGTDGYGGGTPYTLGPPQHNIMQSLVQHIQNQTGGGRIDPAIAASMQAHQAQQGQGQPQQLDPAMLQAIQQHMASMGQPGSGAIAAGYPESNQYGHGQVM